MLVVEIVRAAIHRVEGVVEEFWTHVWVVAMIRPAEWQLR